MIYRIKEQILVLWMAGICFFVMPGCDSGQKAVDEVTGNRALKQYEKAKEDIKKVEEIQKQRWDVAPEDQNQKNGENQENK